MQNNDQQDIKPLNIVENSTEQDISYTNTDVDDKDTQQTSLTDLEDDSPEQEEGSKISKEDNEKEPSKNIELQFNYENLSKDKVIKTAKLIIKQDIPKVNLIQKFKQLKKRIDKINATEKKEAKINFRKKTGSEAGFEYKPSKEIRDFERIYTDFQKIKKSYEDNLLGEQKNNLQKKKNLLIEIEKIIETSFNVQKIKQLKSEWEEITNIPRPEIGNQQKAYRKMMFKFKQQSKIQHDFYRLEQDKNLITKKELCQKAEALLELSNTHKASQEFNKIYQAFKNTGNVPLEAKDDIWDRMHDIRARINKKREGNMKRYKEFLTSNMTLKQNICTKLEKLTQFNSTYLKEWYQATSEIKKLQKEWYTIGHIPKESMDSMYKLFKGLIDTFYDNRRTFFHEFDDIKQKNFGLKMKICEQVEAFKDSQDWNNTAETIIKLQKEWYTIGPVPNKEQNIEKRFKAACDTFFDNKRAYIKQKDELSINFVKEKELIIQEISEINLEEQEFKKAIDDKIKRLVKDMNELPQKRKKEVANKFIKETEKYINKLDMDNFEKEQFKTTIYAKVYSMIPFLKEILTNQKYKLIKQINSLQDEVEVLENNLSFFGNASKKQNLVPEVKKFQKKLEVIIKELEDKNNRFRIIKKYIK